VIPEWGMPLELGRRTFRGGVPVCGPSTEKEKPLQLTDVPRA
jgi:hypothetical protein